MTWLLSNPIALKAAKWGAAILAVLLILYGFRRSGERLGETRVKLDNAERAIRNTQTRREVEHEVDRATPDAVRERLRERWVRPGH